MIVAALAAWLASPPVSIADAALHEAVRRQLTAKSARVYTNDTLPEPRFTEIMAPASPASAPPEPSVAATSDAGDVSAPKEPTPPDNPSPGRAPAVSDEKSWRDRVASLKASLMSDELQARTLQSRVALLQNQFMARDDPAQRQVIGQDLSKALVDLDRIKLKVQSGRLAIEQMNEEARRSGVPPGWLR